MPYIVRSTGTAPTIFHAPGLHLKQRNALFAQVVAYALSQPPKPHPDVHVLTWNTTARISPLEWTLLHHGQLHTVLGKGTPGPWRHSLKHRLTIGGLQGVTAPYVLCLDAFDATYTDLAPAVAMLKQSGKHMILNGERIFWPKQPRYLKRAERQLGGPRPFLNSGAWMADTEYAKDFIQRALALDHLDPRGTEQKVYHILFGKHPDEMEVDRQAQVFCTELNERELAWR